jgi:DedD protein
MEVELKQRLVGASVLIAIAVIFIPMIFDDTRISKNQSITIEIPDEPDALKHKVLSIDANIANNDSSNTVDNTSNTTNFPDKINDDANVIEPEITKKEIVLDVVDNSKKKPPVEIPKKKPVVVTAKPEKKPEVKPEIKKDPVTIVNTGSSENAYRVKLGVFAQQKNAQQLKAQIIQKGKTAIVEKDLTSGQFKVYSQPLNSLSAAKKLSQQIQNLNLKIGKPSIESLDESARLLSESQLDTGWIIQIGIFSSKDNSIKLRDKIRKKGFVAFVDEIDSSKNQKLYRVRVGPNATRDEAETIQSSIKSKMNLKGLIKPHEKQKVVN